MLEEIDKVLVTIQCMSQRVVKDGQQNRVIKDLQHCSSEKVIKDVGMAEYICQGFIVLQA